MMNIVLVSIPYDIKKLLSDCKDRQVLPLLQEALLLGELAAGLALLFHVVCKFLFRSVRRRKHEHGQSAKDWTSVVQAILL